MKAQDKKEIRQIFNEGFEQLILPHFESIDKRFENTDKKFESIDKRFNFIDKKFEENKEDHVDLGNSIGRIEQKLDAEISWRDDASKRLKKVEVKLGFAK